MSRSISSEVGSVPGLSAFIFATENDVCAGPLPKVLPSSLETLQLGPKYSHQENNNKFEGGIPAEWGGLTNLKKLSVMKCGLGGKPLSIRSERFIR